MIRPVGNGVICGATLCPPSEIIAASGQSYRALRDGLLDGTFQAFHAWLPSSGPSGTKTHLRPYVNPHRQLPDRYQTPHTQDHQSQPKYPERMPLLTLQM